MPHLSLLRRWYPHLLWFSAVWVGEGHASATTTLYSIGELQSSLTQASVGDHLVLADGHYRFNGTLLIDTDGLTVSAQSAGGVIFTGSYLNIKIKCDGASLSGIQFLQSHALEDRNIIDVFGDHNQLTDLNFDGCSADKYVCIRAGSRHNTIQDSNFQNKPTTSATGNLIEVQADADVPGYHLIRQCSFQKMPGKGGDNGNEPIRIGEGSMAGFVSRTVVEFCVFNGTALADR